MKKSIIIAASFLFFSACSLFKSKVSPYPGGIVFPVEKSAEIEYQGEVISPIKASNERVFLATRSGFLYCFDAGNQKTMWELKVSEKLQTSPCFGQDRIYVLDGNNVLYAVSKEGSLLWEKSIQDSIVSNIIEYKGRLFAGTAKGLLMALDSVRGEEVWTFQTPGPIRSNISAAANTISFGCGNTLYLISWGGKLTGMSDTGGAIGHTIAPDGSFLYYGTDQKEIFCFDIAARKRRWKIRTGGRVLVPPVFAGKRAFFLCMNNVLYCLDKNNGTILWWNAIPGRSVFSPAVIQENVVVASRSSILVSFDIHTGEEVGRFNAGREFRSNPLWQGPFLLGGFYNHRNDKGLLAFIQKKVAVRLSATPESPQPVNTQIAVTASPVGFHMPEYEFVLCRVFKYAICRSLFVLMKEPESENVVQMKSEKNTWNWFPESEGLYAVGVRVTDEREKHEEWMPYGVLKEEPEVTLAFSKKSPQPIGEEIVFTATAKGMTDPVFEFVLRRVFKIRFFTHSFILSSLGKEVVQEKSESGTWTWNPVKAGIYAIEVVAEGREAGDNSVVLFRVLKPESPES